MHDKASAPTPMCTTHMPQRLPRPETSVLMCAGVHRHLHDEVDWSIGHILVNLHSMKEGQTQVCQAAKGEVGCQAAKLTRTNLQPIGG